MSEIMTINFFSIYSRKEKRFLTIKKITLNFLKLCPVKRGYFVTKTMFLLYKENEGVLESF